MMATAAAATAGFAHLSMAELLAMEKRELAACGTYRLKMTKEERVGDRLSAPQVMDVLVRPSPQAVVGEVVSGPSKGRKFLYNEALRTKEVRVREAGLLGIAAVWIGIDAALTRRDTNHRVTELGFAPILQHFEDDFAKAQGKHRRVDEGLDAEGAWCMRFFAPPGVRGLYADEAFLCIDTTTRVPTRIEVKDADGVFERFRFELVGKNLSLPDAAFTPEGAKI